MDSSESGINKTHHADSTTGSFPSLPTRTTFVLYTAGTHKAGTRNMNVKIVGTTRLCWTPKTHHPHGRPFRKQNTSGCNTKLEATGLLRMFSERPTYVPQTILTHKKTQANALNYSLHAPHRDLWQIQQSPMRRSLVCALCYIGNYFKASRNLFLQTCGRRRGTHFSTPPQQSTPPERLC